MLDLLRKYYSRWHLSNDDNKRNIAEKLSKKHGRLLTIMFSDMEGFSRKTRIIGTEETLGQICFMLDTAQKHTDKNRGRIIRTIGDNIFYAFERPLDAVQTALGIQAELKEQNARISDENQKIELCFGVAYGKCLDFGWDIYGDCVNVASKLAEDIGQGSDIMISREAFDMLADHFDKSLFIYQNATLSDIPLVYYKLACARGAMDP